MGDFLPLLIQLNESGQSPREIAHILNERGFYNKRGTAFSAQIVAAILIIRGIPIKQRSKPVKQRFTPSPNIPLFDFAPDNLEVRYS